MSDLPLPKKQNDFLSSTYNIKDVKIRPFIKQDFSIKPYKIVPMKRIPIVPTFKPKHIHLKEQNKVENIPEVKANNDFNNKLQGIPKHKIPKEDNVLYHEYKLKGLDDSDLVIARLQEEAGTSNKITTSNQMKETGGSKEDAINDFMELYSTKKGIDVVKTKSEKTTKPKLTIEKAVKDEIETKQESDEENSDDDVEQYAGRFSTLRKSIIDEYNDRKTEDDEDYLSYFKGLTNEHLQFILSGVYNVEFEEIKKLKKADLVKKIIDLDESKKGVKVLIDYYEKLNNKNTGKRIGKKGSNKDLEETSSVKTDFETLSTKTLK